MLKKVRIKILCERYEMQGSLFDGDAAPCEAELSSSPERMELLSEGNYLDDGSRVSITYQENEGSGLEGSRATISFHKNEPELVSMIRTGSVKTALVFEKGKRHHCVYQTPIMPFEVCVYTTAVKNELENKQTLHLDYAVEIRGANTERTKMTLTLLPAYDKPRGV